MPLRLDASPDVIPRASLGLQQPTCGETPAPFRRTGYPGCSNIPTCFRLTNVIAYIYALGMTMRITLRAALIGVTLAAGPALGQASAIRLGNLHSHTFYSDRNNTPFEPYVVACGEGLDFFAISEDHHAKGDGPAERNDNIFIAMQLQLYASRRASSVRWWMPLINLVTDCRLSSVSVSQPTSPIRRLRQPDTKRSEKL